MKAYTASPGTLNRGLINLLDFRPKKLIIFVWDSKFVAIRNGRRLGTTLLAQSFKPVLAATRLLFENETRPIVNKTKMMPSKCFLNEKARIKGLEV